MAVDFETTEDFISIAGELIGETGTFDPQEVVDICLEKNIAWYCEHMIPSGITGKAWENACDDISQAYYLELLEVAKQSWNGKSLVGKHLQSIKYQQEQQEIMWRDAEYETVADSPLGRIVTDENGETFVLVPKDLAQLIFEQAKTLELDAEFREEELLFADDFVEMTPIGSSHAKVFHAVRGEGEDIVDYIIQEESVDGEKCYRILLVIEQEEPLEVYESAIVLRKQPKGIVERAMVNHMLIERAEIEQAILELENAVRLGLVSEEEIMMSLRQRFGAETTFNYHYNYSEKYAGSDVLEALRNSSDETKAQAIDWLIDEGFLHSEELYNAAYVLALGDALGISVEEDEWEAEDRDEDERMTRAEAEALADKMTKLLEPYCDFVEVCGSYRRGREDPGDLDIVIILKEGESLPDIVDKLSGEYTAVNWLGEKKTQIIVDGVKVDIRVSTPEGLGAALLYFTGPSGYNIGLRRSAKKRGMKLNEYGIWDRDTNEYLGGATEEEVYKLLDKNWKSPELRRAEETQGMPDHEIGEGINWMPYEDRTSVLKRRRAETFESETNWYSRYGMEIKGFSEPYYTKMGYVVRHPEPSSKMIGDLYEIRPRLIRNYSPHEGWTEVEGYHIPWWYWVDEDSEPISSGKFFNTLDEALRWLRDNPDLQPSVEWEQGHAEEVYYTDAEYFYDWLKDENFIFHNLTSRTHRGPNYGTFRDNPETRVLKRFQFRYDYDPDAHMDEDLVNPNFALEYRMREGLEKANEQLGEYLLDLVSEAGHDLGMDDWDEETLVEVELGDDVDEDQIFLLFPDDSEMQLRSRNVNKGFLFEADRSQSPELEILDLGEINDYPPFVYGGSLNVISIWDGNITIESINGQDISQL